jgi:hypothetical protein
VRTSASNRCQPVKYRYPAKRFSLGEKPDHNLIPGRTHEHQNITRARGRSAKRPTFGGSCLTIRANDRAASFTRSL